MFDDIQWGEETFLDLIEHLTAALGRGAAAAAVHGAPGAARQPPRLAGGRAARAADGEETGTLIGAGVPEGLRERIEAAAAGNPLFIHEMVAMADEAGGEVEVPASLKALLAARLDQPRTGRAAGAGAWGGRGRGLPPRRRAGARPRRRRR